MIFIKRYIFKLEINARQLLFQLDLASLVTWESIISFRRLKLLSPNSLKAHAFQDTIIKVFKR